MASIEKTKKLVQEYQEKVYRGDVTARVLKPGTQDEYLTMNIRGFKNPDIMLPVLPFGILTDVNVSDPENIKLTISTPDEISDKQLLTTARNIVFSSCLIFPGQWFADNNCIASTLIDLIWVRPSSTANLARKCRASSGISSILSPNDGIKIGKTLRR